MISNLYLVVDSKTMVNNSRSSSKQLLCLLAVAWIIMFFWCFSEQNRQPETNGNIYKAANIHNCEVQTELEYAKIRKQEEHSLKYGSVECDELPRFLGRNDINQIQPPDKEIQLARVLNRNQVDHDQNRLQSNASGVINQHSMSTTCSPKYQVSFIKIHKTGSGAIHNVLLRLALRHNLTVALPSCKSEYRNYQIFPAVAKWQYILNKPPLYNYHGYNIFVDHAFYDRNAQLEYMDQNTIFYTQIRSPFSQAVSGFNHFEGVQMYDLQGLDCPLCTFVLSHEKEFYFHGNRHCWGRSRAAPVTRNFQAFTLGYKNASENNITEFKSHLERLDKELFHVSLLEYIDESNLLLKRKMCWHISDVLHIHTHKTKHKTNISPIAEETQHMAEDKHHELSKLDYMLYEFFKEKHFKEIQQQPADFSEELEQYKTLNSQFSELCDKMCKDFDGVDPSDIDRIRRMLQIGIDIPSSSFNSAFRMTYVDCLLLMTSEVVDKNILKVKQYPEACKDITNFAEFGFTPDDCDFKNHVYPGYHISRFKSKILNKEVCLRNFYIDDINIAFDL